ncbi:histidinol-phosphatase [Telmatospirillum sp. J64-1]|uniref:histidinol-phosphatase n=1 Tax=Telmatospirillum sp. J64-1 TaxID=2502183 RepID=UPI00115E9978|nr:histidinol-phosphatase [Telmatospirillum sp. J64-1]
MTAAPATGLSPVDLGEFLDFAEALAGEAGGLAAQWFRKPLDIEKKRDESPVTIADRTIEAALRKRIAARYPDHGLFGEEHGCVGLEAHKLWVIDPIDGTRSFISGWPLWGTLIALLEDGAPQLGIIEIPALRERWIGARGRATRFRNGNGQEMLCKTSPCRLLAEARCYTTSPFYFTSRDRLAVEALLARTHTPRFGGDCYSYAMLAAGHVDLVVEARLEPFDYCALIPVVEGAGGIITDWAGRPLDLESDGRVIAAATPELYAEALAHLRDYGCIETGET